MSPLHACEPFAKHNSEVLLSLFEWQVLRAHLFYLTKQYKTNDSGDAVFTPFAEEKTRTAMCSP